MIENLNLFFRNCAYAKMALKATEIVQTGETLAGIMFQAEKEICLMKLTLLIKRISNQNSG